MSSTAMPRQRACRLCGKPEHGSLACSIAQGWPAQPVRIVASSDPDFVWRTNISGLLCDITGQLLALTEVVQKIVERLEAASNTGDRPE